MGETDVYRALLEKWVNLAERTMTEQPLHFDANRQMDFYQGIRETKKALGEIEPPEITGTPI